MAGLYNDVAGLSGWSGLWGNVVGLWSGATGLQDGSGGATLSLNFLSGALDSRITFTRSSTATFVGSNGLIQTAAINSPRFDYDPVTLAPRGLLIEEQRTNLLLRSEQFDTSSWGKTNVTATPDAAVSPAGVSNAQRLAAIATTSSTVAQTVAVSGTSVTYTVYAKEGTGPTAGARFGVRNLTTATTLLMVTFNYATGTFTYNTGSTGFSAVNVGNGWWRITCTATSGITSGDTVAVYCGFGGQTATAGDHMFAYGAQLEAGAFATSYIPTVASQVTRTADIAEMTGTNFSSWYNQSEGTFVAFGDTLKPPGVSPPANFNSANDGTFSNSVSLRFATSTAIGLVQTGGAAQTVFAGTAYTANTPVKWGMAYQLNNTALCVGGGAVTTDTSVTVGLTMTRMNVGARNGALDQLNGHIRSLTYYNTRLPDAQLQSLTS